MKWILKRCNADLDPDAYSGQSFRSETLIQGVKNWPERKTLFTTKFTGKCYIFGLLCMPLFGTDHAPAALKTLGSIYIRRHLEII